MFMIKINFRPNQKKIRNHYFGTIQLIDFLCDINENECRITFDIFFYFHLGHIVKRQLYYAEKKEEIIILLG